MNFRTKIKIGFTLDSFSPNSQRWKNAIIRFVFDHFLVIQNDIMIQKGIIGQLKA